MCVKVVFFNVLKNSKFRMIMYVLYDYVLQEGHISLSQKNITTHQRICRQKGYTKAKYRRQKWITYKVREVLYSVFFVNSHLMRHRKALHNFEIHFPIFVNDSST